MDLATNRIDGEEQMAGLEREITWTRAIAWQRVEMGAIGRASDAAWPAHWGEGVGIVPPKAPPLSVPPFPSPPRPAHMGGAPAPCGWCVSPLGP